MEDKPIKVVFFTDNLGLGGRESVLVNLCTGLAELNFDLYLLVIGSIVDPSYETQLEKVKIITCNYEAKHEVGFLELLSWVFRKKGLEKQYIRIFEAVDKIHPDIIHSHYSYLGWVIPQAIKKRIGCVLVTSIHGMILRNLKIRGPKLWLYKVLTSLQLKGFHVISISLEIINMMKDNFGLNGRLHLIPNGIDCNFYDPDKTERKLTRKELNVKENDIIITYIARFLESKDHVTLIKALSYLKDIHKIKLCLVGIGEDFENVKQLARELGLEDRILFLKERNDVFQILLNTDIGVFPSLKEGLSMALLEKMCACLPVVVSNIPELVTIVNNEEVGLNFVPQNALMLSQQLRKLLLDKQLREKMGKKARERVLAYFSLEKQAKEHKTLYLNLLKK